MPSKKTRNKRNKLIALFKEQGSVCWLCGKRMTWGHMTFDHIIPRSQGGGNCRENLRLAHRKCNNRRGNQPGIAYERRA